MLTSKAKAGSAAAVAVAAAALLGLGTTSASAAGLPSLRYGAYLYSGAGNTGSVTTVDLTDAGTCHTLATPALSGTVVDGSRQLELYSGPGCTATWSYTTGSLMQGDFPWAMLSYRVIPAT